MRSTTPTTPSSASWTTSCECADTGGAGVAHDLHVHSKPCNQIPRLPHALQPAWACRFEGQHILVVDKVDDSRASLASFITALQGRLDALKAAAGPGQWKEAHVGVFVLHNKRRPKAADLPSEVLDGRCAGGSVPPPGTLLRTHWFPLFLHLLAHAFLLRLVPGPGQRGLTAVPPTA